MSGLPSPSLKFRDLGAKLESGDKVRAIPLQVDTESSKATDVTSIVKITISFPRNNAATPAAELASTGALNVVGQVKTLTGHIVELFEEEVTIKQSSPGGLRVQKSIPLFNVHYRLAIAAEIAHTGKSTSWTGILNVRP